MGPENPRWRRRRRKKNVAASASAMTATATLTPMPALAPVDRLFPDDMLRKTQHLKSGTFSQRDKTIRTQVDRFVTGSYTKSQN